MRASFYFYSTVAGCLSLYRVNMLSLSYPDSMNFEIALRDSFNELRTRFGKRLSELPGVVVDFD